MSQFACTDYMKNNDLLSRMTCTEPFGYAQDKLKYKLCRGGVIS